MTNDNKQPDVREFEEAIRQKFGFDSRDMHFDSTAGRYDDGDVNDLWIIWQAALQSPSVAETDVIAERNRQKSQEGWTPEHDDEHASGELAYAATSYAIEAAHLLSGMVPSPTREPPFAWPWDKSWWKPSDARRNLVKAGALILAEIERLDRAMLYTSPPSPESQAAPQPLQEGENIHTNAPDVSSEHIEALAKMCGLIPAYTQLEWVQKIVGFARVVLNDNAVQEAFVRANAGALSQPAAQDDSELVTAAEAVVARWDTPTWKEAEHTGVFIYRLRTALASHIAKKARGE